jgi:hypothetical protein
MNNPGLAVEPRRVRGVNPHSEKGHEWPSQRVACGAALPVLKHGPNTRLTAGEGP